jgi:CubicO group peptidase (beta-lactamase class C family)
MSHHKLLRSLLALVTVLPLAAAAPPQPTTDPAPSLTPVTRHEERVARIQEGLVSPLRMAGEPVTRHRLEEIKEASGVPAMALAIVDECAVAWAGGWGTFDDGETPVGGSTPFQVGSVSKTVTATVAMTMVAEGTLDLDDPVNQLLRSWKLPDNDLSRKTPVLVRHLLSHSAGLTRTAFWFERGTPLPPLPTILKGESDTPPIVVEQPPGTRSAPSNSGFLLLQHLLEEVGGKSLAHLADERVFIPLGMRNSAFEPVDGAFVSRGASGHQRDGTAAVPLVPAAPGGLWSSAEDLGRLLAGLMSSWHGRPGSLLPRDVARRMLSREIDDMGLGVHLWGEAESLSLQQAGGGIGSQSRLVAYPERCQGAALVINSDRGRRLIAETLAAVGQEYGWPGLPLQADRVRLPAESLARFAGSYAFDTSPGSVMKFSVDGENLLAQFGDRNPFPVQAISDTVFVSPGAANQIRFLTAADGTISGLTIGTAGFYGSHLTRVD